MLDQIFLQRALRDKSFLILDLSFPQPAAPEFKRTYGDRYIYAPLQKSMAPGLAAGLASLERMVLVLGMTEDLRLPDSTLNVKVISESLDGSWENFEQKLSEFGEGVLLIPLQQ